MATALMCVVLVSVWFLVDSDAEDASIVADAGNPGMPPSTRKGHDSAGTVRDETQSRREASLAPVEDGVSVPVHPQNAEALESFGRTFHFEVGVSQLSDPAFAEEEDSHLGGLCIFTRNSGLTAKDLRFLFDSRPEDDPLRTWAVLGVAYSKDVSQDDLAWLESLATMESRVLDATQLAALHGLRASARVEGVDSSSALSRVAQTLLQRASGSDPSKQPAGIGTQIELALRALEELGPALQATSLAEYGANPSTSDSASELCFKTLATAGGAEGGLMVIDAVMAGNANARSAIASLRDPATTPILITWVEAEARTGGDFQLASAAVAGLLSVDEASALQTIEGLLRDGGVASKAAIVGLEAFDEPRSRGTFLQLKQMLVSLEAESEHKSTAGQALEVLRRGGCRIDPWLLPGPRARQETRQGLNRAISVLPSDSEYYVTAFWDLVRLSSKHELDSIEQELDLSSPYATQIRRFIQQRRSDDGGNGTE